MFLFGGNKLKVRSEEDEDGIKTFVEYYGMKKSDEFKVKVLNEMIGENLCLIVLDSRMLYFGNQVEHEVPVEEIVENLGISRIAYKKFEIKKVPEVSMFGISIKKGTKKTDRDYVIGFVVNKYNFKRIEEYVNRMNLYYFIDNAGLGEEDLLQKLSENYEEIDEMSKEFYCEIFNNNYISQLVISSENENAMAIKETVGRCHSELK
ncbi:hypothetical protein [Clostridium beijerinckii]|uniref:hypothetical protein n=1 Tax=Clostridium beijerinckii TaxID=1520 RepID=UPI00080A488E|nr:hypothetical protein [Clostridium beijerinckii]OCA98338.1 hypothetical protein BGS1_23185 [Clostridium beijerinckii]